MYSIDQLVYDYGKITGYVKPKDKFRASIMSLSNTGGGGRGSYEGSIIGDVINHGKKKFWVRGGDFHYHLGASFFYLLLVQYLFNFIQFSPNRLAERRKYVRGTG